MYPYEKGFKHNVKPINFNGFNESMYPYITKVIKAMTNISIYCRVFFSDHGTAPPPHAAQETPGRLADFDGPHGGGG